MMMTTADAIAVTQLRNRLDQAGDMVATLVRDAYARGLTEGLRRARAERPSDGAHTRVIDEADHVCAYDTPGAGPCADCLTSLSDPAERRPPVV